MLAKILVPWGLVVMLAALPGEASAAEWPAVHRLPAAVAGLEPSTWPALIEVDGELAALYAAETDNRVTFRRGDQAQTLDREAPAPGGRYFQLHQAGRQLYALWWNPTPGGGKWLYARASADGGKTFGPLRTLNTKGGVLADYHVAADGAGNVVVIFQDERDGYGVYVNRSTDGGLTWLDNDIRLDVPPARAAETPPEPALPPAAPRNEAAEQQPAAAPAQPKPSSSWSAVSPRLLYQDGQWLAVWQQLEPAGGGAAGNVGRWLARTSTDGGLNWAPAVEIQRLPQQSIIEMITLSHQGQVYVIGFVATQGLLAFRSADMGRQWTSLGTLPVAGPDEMMSYLSATGAGDNVLVAYTTQRDIRKTQVAAALLAGGAWQTPPWRLDRKDKDFARAAYENVATLPNGAVIAVWEDYRYILPAIYLDYSADGGKTWLAAPRLLTEPGRLPATTPRLVVGANEVVVVFDQWRNAVQHQRDAAYLTLPYQPDRGLVIPEVPSVQIMPVAESLQRIRQRSQELWTLRVQGKYAETWNYYDPVYRARQGNVADFLRTQGLVTFKAFEVGEPTVDDIIGKIPVTVTYIPPYPSHMLQFPKAPPPPRTDTFPERWIWFYDDWYMVPEALVGPSHLDY